MKVEKDKSAEIEEEVSLPRECFRAIGLFLLPVIYGLSYPWVWYGLHQIYLPGTPSAEIRTAIRFIYAPLQILINSNDSLREVYNAYEFQVVHFISHYF